MPIWGLSTESMKPWPPPGGGRGYGTKRRRWCGGTGVPGGHDTHRPFTNRKAVPGEGTVIRLVLGAPFRMAARSAQGPVHFPPAWRAPPYLPHISTRWTVSLPAWPSCPGARRDPRRAGCRRSSSTPSPSRGCCATCSQARWGGEADRRSRELELRRAPAGRRAAQPDHHGGARGAGHGGLRLCGRPGRQAAAGEARGARAERGEPRGAGGARRPVPRGGRARLRLRGVPTPLDCGRKRARARAGRYERRRRRSSRAWMRRVAHTRGDEKGTQYNKRIKGTSGNS